MIGVGVVLRAANCCPADAPIAEHLVGIKDVDLVIWSYQLSLKSNKPCALLAAANSIG